MKPEKVLEVCPVCGSSELYLEAGGYTGKVYHCKNCDYMGALIVEADEEMARAIREDYEKSGHKRRDD
jgi:RNA polymerase subunit RPABC4/transcription elongation factor Spt4